MLNNSKNKKLEINLFDILNHVYKKKKLIILITFLFMIIGYLVGLSTPQKKKIKIIFNTPKIEWLLAYNDLLFYDKKKSELNFNQSNRSFRENYIYKENYLLFVFLEFLNRNINSKKILETYLREKNIDESIEIYCSGRLFCEEIDINFYSISEKKIFDLINHFIQITKIEHISFIKTSIENKSKFASFYKQNSTLEERDIKILLSELKNDVFFNNYINEITVINFNQRENKIFINTIIGSVLGFFLSLFIILLRLGHKNLNLKKLI